MKRQILTLTMCLALTATSALAKGTKAITAPVTVAPAVAASPVAGTLADKPAAVTTTTTTKTVTKVTTKSTAAVKPVAKSTTKAKTTIKKVVKPATPVVAPVQPKVLTREEARRVMMYEKLGFSAEQKTKADAFDAKTRAGVSPLMCKLHSEVKKYKDLKAKKANFFAIWKQKQAVKSAKKDVDKYLQKSRVEFEAIMTPAQKVKFEAFKAQRKKEMAARRHGAHNMGPKPPMGAPEHMGPPTTIEHEGPQCPAPVAPSTTKK